MKKITLCTFLAVFLIFQSLFVVHAQTSKKAEITRINAYCKTVDAFVKKYKSPHLIFADISDYNDDSKVEWRKFASENTLEKFRETSETYTIAYNWLKKGKIVKSNFTLFSPSGDWAQYVYHYFRDDATLAKAETEMRTFNGDLIVRQNFYFDPKGKLLRKTVKYLDLRTQKPIKPTREFLENNASLTNDVEYFKRIDKLPFASLLKKKRN